MPGFFSWAAIPMPSTPNTTRTESLVLIGGGGHALVIAEAARLAGMSLSGFFDDHPAALIGQGKQGLVHLGSMDQLERLVGRAWILAAGGLSMRARLREELQRLGAADGGTTLVHPTAFVSPSARLGPGVFVGPLAIVHSGAIVESHAIINSGAIVEHNCIIGSNSHIAPGSVIGGDVQIGPETLIGLGARVLPQLTIGAGCTVGAGAVVTRSLHDKVLVVGVPARETVSATRL